MGEITALIARQISKHRERLGLTKKELANFVGVAPSTVSGWENADYAPSADTLVKLCNLFEITLDEIYGLKQSDKTEDAAEANLLKKYRGLDGHGRKAVDTILDIEAERVNRGSDVGQQGRGQDKTASNSGSAAHSVAGEAAENEDKEEPGVIYLAYPYLAVSAGTGVYLDDDSYEILPVPDSPLTRRANFALRVSGDSMEPDYEDGDILLVRTQPAIDEGELGIFVLNGDAYFKKWKGGKLVSLNPAYPDITIKEFDDLRCIGKVIGKLKR